MKHKIKAKMKGSNIIIFSCKCGESIDKINIRTVKIDDIKMLSASYENHIILNKIMKR